MAQQIPTQFTGKQVDCFKSVELASLDRANDHYETVKQRLLDVNNWHVVADIPSAEFKIVNASNELLDRTLREGDRIRIDIPGPGLPSSGGYDWVRVERITSEDGGTSRQTLLTLRPCPDPNNDNTETAHFFERIATSTFLVQQKSNQVSVRYAGRNEVINTENLSTWDNFRNFIIGLGAKMGASYPQWKALTEGIAEVRDRPDQ